MSAPPSPPMSPTMIRPKDQPERLRDAKADNTVGEVVGEVVRAAFGSVVNVRSIPTRGVTRIEIEIPIESHVEATRLLFDQDVLVMPANMQHLGHLGYGMIDTADATTTSDAAPGHEGCSRSSAPEPPSRFAPGAAAPAPRIASLGRRDDTLDILRWLGARCREESFQEWLGVRTEAAAIEVVRRVCGVRSRADIPTNPAARARFVERLLDPFRRQVAFQAALATSAP